MPEGYTHIRTARAAARLANIEPADGAAFDCGANGPDMLFCYRVWRKSARRGEDLPKIGDRLHGENTGAFLQALLENAKTPAQQSYAMGFLCHYAADCALHPYVVMITKPGAAYGMPGGHGYFEIALDSFLHQKDTGKSAAEIFSEHGIYLSKANNDRIQGWYELREWLKPIADEQGRPAAKIRIFENCINLIRTLPLLQHDEYNPNDAAKDPHELTHAPDAIRYFVASRPYAAEPLKPPKVKWYKDQFEDYYNADAVEQERLLMKWGNPF